MSTTPSKDKDYTNFMFQLLTKIGNMIKERGILNTIFTIFLFLFVYLFLFQPERFDNIVMNAIEVKAQEDIVEHNKGLEYRSELNKQLPMLLDKLLINTNGGRVVVYELHNSGNSIIGIPFYKMSAMFERLSFEYQNDETQKYLTKDLQNENLSHYNKMLEMLIQDKYFLFNDIENSVSMLDNYVYKYMINNHTKSLFACGIFDYKTGNLIGVISITSDEPNVFDRTVIASEMVSTVQIISNYFNRI